MSQKMKNALILIGVIAGAIIFLCFALGLLYTWLFTSNQIEIDVGTIVSIVLALFSIIISMMFYFKASETSNSFYNNSYEHMKDQSVLLGRIEERFGEKLGNVEKILSNAQGIGDNTQEINQKLKEAIEEKKVLSNKLSQIENDQGTKKEELVEELKKRERIIENLLNENAANNDMIQQYLIQIRNSTLHNNQNKDINSGNRKIANKIIEIFTKHNMLLDDERLEALERFAESDEVGFYTKREKRRLLYDEIKRWTMHLGSNELKISPVALMEIREVLDLV